MFQRLALVLTAMAVAAASFAAVIRGTVNDTEGQPLPDATVRLLAARDSAFVAGGVSDDDGRFTLDHLRRGRYILQISYIGYHPSFSDVTLKSDSSAVRIAEPIVLKESTIVLREATAIGVATPITVKEDTIEYNASSYTTPPNAVVGDLLKRLPGVEVGSDGSITAHGQTVKKILVDGEEFFSDDPAVASKNLPVSMVQSAQVINRKSDLARMTGVDDGEDETVINLTVKKGMKDGWFGTIEGGYGTDDRWGFNAIVNMAKNSNTVTLVTNANNCNNAGFTDSNRGGFRRFGGSSGINTTESVGVNFNVGNKQIFRVGGDLKYSHSDRDNQSTSHRINIFNNGNTTQNSASNSNDRGHNISGNLRMKWQPDSFNTVDFQPNFNVSVNDSESFSTTIYEGKDGTRTRNNSTSHGKAYSLSGRLIYNHSFASHRGRSVSMFANYSLSNSREDQYDWSRNAFMSLDSLYENYQETDYHSWSNGINARVSWTEPIGNAANGNFLEFAYSMNYRWNNADTKVLRHVIEECPIPEDIYRQWSDEELWYHWTMLDRRHQDVALEPDLTNSNSFRNNYFNQNIRAGYKRVTKAYTLNAGLSVNPQMSKSDNISHPERSVPTRWVWNYSPFMWFRYKISTTTSLNVNYNGRSSEPSLTQLQPYIDYSDPMNVVEGNPGLKPSFNHSFRVRYQTFDKDRQQSIMVMANGGMTQNAIASNVTTNKETGGRYTRYANVNGNWNGSLFTMYSRPVGHSKLFTLNNHLRLNYSQTVGFVNGERNRATSTRVNESFGVAFRPDNLELSLRPTYSLNYNTNSIQSRQNSTVHSYGGNFSGTWYTPVGLVLSSDLDYSRSTGYSSGYDTDQWRWNASLSYMFLKGKVATLAVKAYDILNQNKSISRSETAQYIQDSWQKTLGRYVMVTFSYKFSTLGGGRQPDMDSGFGDEHRGPRGGDGPRGGMGGGMPAMPMMGPRM